MYIATLINWDSEHRSAGTAWIRVFDTVASVDVDPITAEPGQTARQAVEAAGWTVASKPVRERSGKYKFRIERAEAAQVPPAGLSTRGAEAAVAGLLGRAGLI